MTLDLKPICADLLAEHKLVPEAHKALVALAVGNGEVRDLLLSEAASIAGLRLIEAAMRERVASDRAERRTTERKSQCRPANIAEHGAAVAAGLLETFEVLPGLVLGDATREDLNIAASGWATKATDARIKASWLRLLAQSVPPGQRVRDRLSEQRVAELRSEAIREA